jgi:L-asparaginase/Glu-tRNA(Gln) amidotransferase subunit D
MNKLSENMKPNDWLEISSYVKKSADKILVTHGTDTMIYSSVALASVYENSKKKIVFTGSLNSIDHPKSDVEISIKSSIDALINDNINNGVYINFRSEDNYNKAELHHSYKTKPMYFDEKSFNSLSNSIIGKYDKDWNILNNIDNQTKCFDQYPKKIDKDLVDILKVRPGFELSENNQDAKAIIIEGYHSGTAPANDDLVSSLNNINCQVYLSSKMTNVIKDDYESVQKLRKNGIKIVEDIQPHVLYIKFLIGLNNGYDPNYIVSNFC